tara:strand:- start:206 stop:466 length:261 start_codon:yes stop_codon:yes gene_type:complete
MKWLKNIEDFSGNIFSNKHRAGLQKKVCGNKELCSKSILIHGKNKQKEYCNWPSFFKLLDEGKIKFDGEGRPRWFQATTVGDVMLA